MKKILLLVACLFYVLTLYSQGNVIDIPNVFPASPEASTLGQFGEIPVNMSMGTNGLSIPIYTITEGKYSLPLSLNYFNNGLVVNNIPGVLGLGWSLSAGGMVTRQMNGRPDEELNGYSGTNTIGDTWVVPFYEGTLSTTQERDLKDHAARGEWDTQPDKFMVSVGNMSASFYFNEDKNPVIKPYKPYNIQLINSANLADGFVITDDNGISYRFDEKEYSDRIGNTYGPDDVLATPGEYVSGWKVTKITLPSTRDIDFNYTSYDYDQELVSQSQDIMLPATVQGAQTRIRKYKVKSKLLAGITFSLGSIDFVNVTLPHTSPITPNQYLSRLDAIKIKNGNDDIVYQYDLTYDDVNKTRKLLQSVEMNSDDSNTYEFQYIGIPSDNINFAEQDFWGYANTNSTGKLVNVENPYSPRKPNFTSAKVGALSKVTYPTKGFTEFTYEPNTYDPGVNGDELDDFNDQANNPICATYNEFYTTPTSPPMYAYNQPSGATIFRDYQDTFTITQNTPASIFMEVSAQGLAGKVEVKLERSNGTVIGCDDPNVGECNPNTPCNKSVVFIQPNFPTFPVMEAFSKNIYLEAGTYTFSIKITGSNTQNPAIFTLNPPNHVYAIGEIKLNRGSITPPQARSRETGGIRISNVKSCPNASGAGCIEKEYIYETDEGISQGHLFRRRNLFKSQYTVHSAPETNDFLSYGSSSNVPLGSYSGSHIIYKKVIEKYLGSGTENNGSKETKFNFVEVPDPINPYIIKDHKEYQNGKVLEERIVDNQGADQKVIFSEYDFDENTGQNDRVIGFKAVTTYITETVAARQYANDTFYFSNSMDVDRLVMTRDFNWLGTDSFEIQANFDYTNPEGHLKEETIVDSDGKIDKTEYLYPYDLNTGVYTNMVNAYQLASPVKVDTYTNNVKISSVQTEYDDWGVNNIIKPNILKNAKGTDVLQSRVIYHNYDELGNPLEVSQASGVRMSYIWGYNNSLPVAKLDDVGYNQIQQSTVSSIKNSSNVDFDRCIDGEGCNEESLRAALNNLRVQFPDAMITTYTYDPLIGVTSVTDPKGYTSYYKYDDQNRLEYIIDEDDNIIQKTNYHLKN